MRETLDGMNPLAKYSDMRLCRVLQATGRAVGPRARILREQIFTELGRRAAMHFKAARLRRRGFQA